MANNIWRKVRLWGLVGLIAGDVSMLLIMALAGQWIWFTTFSAITLIIVLAEIFSYFFTKEKITISTRYGLWIKESPVWALIALGCFLIAMISLAVHLVGYAF
jgi:type IV secretory pathway TrbF-like protein